MELKFNNLSFAYGKQSPAVLQGVNAGFGPGLHLLLGPNGAGKTTLLKVAAGLLRPGVGACLLGGADTALRTPWTISSVFYLDDDCRFPLPTVNEMARRHAPFYPRFSDPLLRRALAAFGMTGDERLASLSLGGRHKANIAYALALGTRVLLLDEPANGLDIASKQALTTLLAETLAADDERCIIVATHTVQEMRSLFDSVSLLHNGRMVVNAPTATVAERLSFLGGTPLPDALFYIPAVEGPTQVVPNANGSRPETPIDYSLLYMAAIGPHADRLRTALQ